MFEDIDTELKQRFDILIRELEDPTTSLFSGAALAMAALAMPSSSTAEISSPFGGVGVSTPIGGFGINTPIGGFSGNESGIFNPHISDYPRL